MDELFGKEEKEEKEEKELSRRELLVGAGKVAAGAVVVSAGGLALFSDAEAKGVAKAKYPWPYKKIDPKKAAAIAYNNWYRGFCAYAVSSGILIPLQHLVGEPYTLLPPEAFAFGHGGTVGWGTLCGTLFGAGIASSFAAGRTGEKIINDVMAWYCDTTLPIYKPAKPRATFKKTNASGSPLCHISVGKWMKAEGVAFSSPQRRDRCARLAADVTMKTVELLNDWADGKYKPAYGDQAAMYQIPTQNNCTECHGNEIPGIPGL